MIMTARRDKFSPSPPMLRFMGDLPDPAIDRRVGSGTLFIVDSIGLNTMYRVSGPSQIPWSNRMLQSLNTPHQTIISLFQTVRGPSPGTDIAFVEILFFPGLDRPGRFGFHQEGRYQIDGCDGPKAAYEEKEDRGSPDPENGKIEIFRGPFANSQYKTVSRTVEAAVEQIFKSTPYMPVFPGPNPRRRLNFLYLFIVHGPFSPGPE